MSGMAGESFQLGALLCAATILCVLAALAPSAGAKGSLSVYRIDHVVDGDTVTLMNGGSSLSRSTRPRSIRHQCYGRAASRWTKRIVPAGTRVRLPADP